MSKFPSQHLNNPRAIRVDTGIEFLKGVGPRKGELLSKELGITNAGQLLHHFPFRYIDRTRYYKINELSEELPFVQLIGRILSMQIIGERHKRRLIAKVADETGSMELVWFQSIKWIEERIVIGNKYIVFGKPTLFNGMFSIAHPELESYPRSESGVGNLTLQPVYSSTEKLKKSLLDSRGLRNLVSQLLETDILGISERMPDYILNKYKLCDIQTAIRDIHFPPSVGALDQAERRLKFDELFFIQLELLHSKQLRALKYKGLVFEKAGDIVHTFYNDHLPFELTNAQKRVIKEIRSDTQRGVQMNRLIQGDVGSGKTMVALMSMLLAIDNGFQACMMAPTEILARQHYESISALLAPTKVKIALLTGSSRKKHRREIHENLMSGDLQILIGTHALIEDNVQFKNVGLVVIDEQHRFGVEQRAKLWRKNPIPPHILVMTATPIPRTLAMTLYGDLDVSVIDELPAGRIPIETIHLVEGQRLRMFGFIRSEIAKGRQVYVVYPLIKESEKMDLLYLEVGIEQLRHQFPLPAYQISIVHGKLSNADKAYEMKQFVDGKTQIMVATTVIEVGVNIPNATVMVVENAERFGLSQLHQLRGRVGRGAEKSYCILMSGQKLSQEGKLRLETMVRTNNGFEIAEIDLQLRGPGDISGTQQSGVLDLKIADLGKDQVILQEARNTVIKIFEEDPKLELPKHSLLRCYLDSRRSGIALDKIS